MTCCLKLGSLGIMITVKKGTITENEVVYFNLSYGSDYNPKVSPIIRPVYCLPRIEVCPEAAVERRQICLNVILQERRGDASTRMPFLPVLTRAEPRCLEAIKKSRINAYMSAQSFASY